MTKTYQNLTEQFTYVKPGTCSNNEGVHCKKKQTTDGLLGNGIIMFPYFQPLLNPMFAFQSVRTLATVTLQQKLHVQLLRVARYLTLSRGLDT